MLHKVAAMKDKIVGYQKTFSNHCNQMAINPHFAPKAKRAIYLFMSGAPPQIDLFDYKPNLAAQFNNDMPASVRGNQQLTGMTAGQARFPIAPAHWPFKQYGQTGTWISDLLPYTARMVDDLTFIKSTNTDAINHEPAIMLMNTGNMNAGKPCLGAWLAYGLQSGLASQGADV